MAVPRLLVVGGNGFLGSAICKGAVSKGWQVSSLSSSGNPYTTPAGHTPKWVHKVSWHPGSAFDPPSYASLVDDSTAVVHTLGVLLEDSGYKNAVKDGDVLGIVKALASSFEGNGNPLKTEQERKKGYDGMNRDSALTVLDTLLSTPAPAAGTPTRPFVYISAADAFRPVVPLRYIESKRQAEHEIIRRVAASPDKLVRPLFIRPGLMYHPHIRPISTLPAFILSLTASVPFGNPFASTSLLGSAIESLSTHPIHVDHVADAIIRGIQDEHMSGVVDLDTMREWAGFQVNGPTLQHV